MIAADRRADGTGAAVHGRCAYFDADKLFTHEGILLRRLITFCVDGWQSLHDSGNVGLPTRVGKALSGTSC